MIRRETIKEIGYLDDRYFLYFEEIDYCLRAQRAGWDVVFYNDAQVVHLGGQSSINNGQKISKEIQLKSIRITSEFRYYRKLYSLLYVFISAVIELLWNSIVLIKNLFNSSFKGIHKRNETIITIRLIISTLWNDNFGKGREAI